MDIKETISNYLKVVHRRKELEAEAEKLKKEQEIPLKEAILQYMQETGMSSVKYPELGHVMRVMKAHYEVRDKQAFALAILQAMVTAYKAGRPVVDALIVQARPSKEALEVYMEETGTTVDAAGLALVEKPELSIRRT